MTILVRPCHFDADGTAAAYALGILDGAERAAFERHLATCDTCPDEVAAYLAAAADVPLAYDEIVETPRSMALRDRILDAAREERDAAPTILPAATETGAAGDGGSSADDATTPGNLRQFPIRFTTLAIAATLAVLLGASLLVRLSLGGATATPSPAVTSYALGSGGVARGEARYESSQQRLSLAVAGLPPLGAGQVYQLWVARGGAIQPISVFSFANGAGTVDAAVDLADASALYITIEPGPGGSASPTSPAILAGELSRATTPGGVPTFPCPPGAATPCGATATATATVPPTGTPVPTATTTATAVPTAAPPPPTALPVVPTVPVAPPDSAPTATAVAPVAPVAPTATNTPPPPSPPPAGPPPTAPVAPPPTATPVPPPAPAPPVAPPPAPAPTATPLPAPPPATVVPLPPPATPVPPTAVPTVPPPTPVAPTNTPVPTPPVAPPAAPTPTPGGNGQPTPAPAPPTPTPLIPLPPIPTLPPVPTLPPILPTVPPLPTLPPILPTVPPLPTLPPILPTLPPILPTLPPILPTLPPILPTLPPILSVDAPQPTDASPDPSRVSPLR